MGKKEKKRGDIAFDSFYKELYKERWIELKQSLLKESQYMTLNSSLLKEYYIEEASFYPVKNLDIKEYDQILDLCAAPGGKSLCMYHIADCIFYLTVNELSKERKKRLQRNLQEFLPENLFKEVKFINTDGSKLGLRIQNKYDRILVDAPCSSERHLLHSLPHLKQWSPGRPRGLAIRQHALLCSALELVKPGGRIVYSTCSINEKENDGVIEKLLKKRRDRVRIISVEEDFGEKTQYGWQIFPDKSRGLGPIYLCTMERIK